jgi:hypothetical protein
MDFIKKYKLRILSILSVLFLFLPFVKQCDNVEYANSNPICDGCEVSTDSQSLLSDIIFNLEVYFIEESESVIDLCLQSKILFELESSKEFIVTDGMIISSIFLSILLVIFSFNGVFLIFANRHRFLSKLYLLNIIIVLLILFVNGYVFIDRIGKIKIGFYLLLITNFYLFNHFRKLKIEE